MPDSTLPAQAPAANTPPSISVAIVANLPRGTVTDEIIEACDTAELVISLGNVDLAALTGGLHPNKPAVCVLGGRDRPYRPPEPFKALHGNGLKYKQWRIVGLSGAAQARQVSDQGVSTTEKDADALLRQLSPSDILLTHTPPAHLPAAPGASTPAFGLEAVADYIDAALPAYCFYAAEGTDTVEVFEWEDDRAATLVVGVSGLYVPPPLVFF